MVVRVAERARQAVRARVVVATDDSRIADAVARARHRRGHDARRPCDRHRPPRRSRRTARARADEIVVNVQGDEPLLDPALMRRVAGSSPAQRDDAAMATACHPIADAAEAFNPNVVKVVLDARNYALYFSRATIPWARDAFAGGRARDPRRAAALPPLRALRLPRGLPAARFRRLARRADRSVRSAGAVARAVARLPDRRRDRGWDAGAGCRHRRRSRARARSCSGNMAHRMTERA